MSRQPYGPYSPQDYPGHDHQAIPASSQPPHAILSPWRSPSPPPPKPASSASSLAVPTRTSPGAPFMSAHLAHEWAATTLNRPQQNLEPTPSYTLPMALTLSPRHRSPHPARDIAWRLHRRPMNSSTASSISSRNPPACSPLLPRTTGSSATGRPPTPSSTRPWPRRAEAKVTPLKSRRLCLQQTARHANCSSPPTISIPSRAFIHPKPSL
jgi:hypothetical protein